MPPETPSRIRGARALTGAVRVGSGDLPDGFLVDELFDRSLFAGRLENAALEAMRPLDSALFEFSGGQAGGLQSLLELHLGPGSPHELLGALGEQKDHAELAVDSFGHLLDHGGLTHSFVARRRLLKLSADTLDAARLPGCCQSSGPHNRF